MKNINPLIYDAKNLTVLYVESDSSIRMNSKKLFDSLFKEVIEAYDGKEALALYMAYYKKTNNYVDIVITEINIPKMNGNDLLLCIKDINKHQRVIVTTIQKNLKYILESLKIGVDDYLLKPITKFKYLDSLQKVIAKVQYTQKNREEQNYLNDLINKKEEILQEQEKMAQIGSLLESIAHQWKDPPLNSIGILVSGMEYYLNNGIDINNKELKNFITVSKQQIEHLSETLNEFRSFYDDTKMFKTFKVSDMIDSILLLVKNEFIMHKIDIRVHIYDDVSIRVIKNEFKHVILNLLNNAKDAFKKNNIKNKKIDIHIAVCADGNMIQIEDNAGGIPEDIFDTILEKGVSSKQDKFGSGIGLNMVSKILDKYHCTLDIKNTTAPITHEKGTSITIKVPTYDKQ